MLHHLPGVSEESLKAAEITKATEIAVAYGLGWNRNARAENGYSDDWNDLWPGAYQELTNAAKNQVEHAFKAFDRQVENFQSSKTRFLELEDNYYGVSMTMVSEFIGQEESFPRRLSIWNPAEGSLYGWLNFHILGMPHAGARLTPGFVATGRLFGYLNELGLLGCDECAFHRCCRCEKEWIYDGSTCCGTNTLIKPKKLLFVPGVFLPKTAFRRCLKEGGCEFNLYSEENQPPAWGKCCCGSDSFSPRLSTLFIRRRFGNPPPEFYDFLEPDPTETPT